MSDQNIKVLRDETVLRRDQAAELARLRSREPVLTLKVKDLTEAQKQAERNLERQRHGGLFVGAARRAARTEAARAAANEAAEKTSSALAQLKELQARTAQLQAVLDQPSDCETRYAAVLETCSAQLTPERQAALTALEAQEAELTLDRDQVSALLQESKDVLTQLDTLSDTVESAKGYGVGGFSGAAVGLSAGLSSQSHMKSARRDGDALKENLEHFNAGLADCRAIRDLGLAMTELPDFYDFFLSNVYTKLMADDAAKEPLERIREGRIQLLKIRYHLTQRLDSIQEQLRQAVQAKEDCILGL